MEVLQKNRKGIFSRKGRKILYRCLVVSSLLLFGACSDDNDPGQSSAPPQTPSNPNTSYTIGENPNMPTGGTIIAQYGDSPIQRMIDNDPRTYYSTNHARFYVVWQGTEEVVMGAYTLMATETENKRPIAWNLYGSNTDEEDAWVLLDKQTGQKLDANKEAKYILANETAYKNYKLEVTYNNGASSTEIAEWKLIDAESAVDIDAPYEARVDYTPTMLTAGTAVSQYSDSPEGQDVTKLFDGDLSTKFVTGHNTVYVEWRADAAKDVNYYTLTSSDGDAQNDPVSWNLFGYIGGGWSRIDAQTDQTFAARGEQKRYDLDETKKNIQYFRLEITQNGGGDAIELAEWAIGYELTDIDDLMDKASGWSTSSVTPMGTHFENRHQTTDEDRAWLLDPANEPQNFYNDGWTYQEFKVELYPFGDPLPADVNQHGIGNCCALAIFGSFAYLYPDFIKDIITDNGDGTFTVDMFDPMGQPVQVCVNSMFLADGNGNMQCCTGKGDNKATWSTVLEKAMMKWQAIYKCNENVGGIGSEHVAPLFTGEGNSFAFAPNALTKDELEHAVKYLLKTGMITVGGFNTQDIPAPDGSGSTVTGHAYTFMYSAAEGALFSMRNPWGWAPGADGSRDGVINIFEDNVTRTIDVRTVYPGKAANYGSGRETPYTPPLFAAQMIRISTEIMRNPGRGF